MKTNESDAILEMMRIEKRRKNFNYMLLTLGSIIFFMLTLIAGIALGMKIGFYMVFEGIAIATNGANFNGNITIDLNETALINEFNNTIVPELIRGAR